MFHLYNVARGNMSLLVPKEVRIIRHLLSIADPRESFAELTNAFLLVMNWKGRTLTVSTREDSAKVICCVFIY